MRIILYELKKLFQWKIVCLLFLICLLFYYLFLQFDFTHFPNGRPALDSYRVTKEMIRQYGYMMNDQEFAHFKAVYEKRKKEADAYLQARPEYVQAGIGTYAKFREVDRENPKIGELVGRIMFADQGDLFWELQARESLIEYYEHKWDWPFDKPLTQEEYKRTKEVVTSGHIMSSEVLDNYQSLIGNMAILITVSVMFVVSPIFLRDRRQHIVLLQYASKTGRRLFHLKLWAALIAAGLVTSLELALFFMLYRGNDVHLFFKADISSVFSYEIFWFHLTFLQYILLTVGCIYILAFVLTIIVGVLSNFVSNYISLVGFQVPLVILFLKFGIDYLVVRITEISMPIYFGPAAYSVIILIGILLYIWAIKREKNVDIVH
ncbi:hypothetical protein [Anoxybacteroides tepidamans]|uniref:hypothetical protein n=1 Tax=Anoxybacteroides tepidamans TaxID=265948 RepID=UPI0004836199|nr:hypothetical protein [Anoxybacillus tepidamans]